MQLLLSYLRPQTDNPAINYASLVLRIVFGLLMMRYGLMKIENYSEWAPGFMNFLGLSGPISLGLVIFAELFCAAFVVLGFATRLSLIPLIVTMLVAFFIAHAADPFDKKEHALVFLFPYISLLILGPGKFSLDAVLFRKK